MEKDTNFPINIGVHEGKIFMSLPEPMSAVSFDAEQALEVATIMIAYVRQLTPPIVGAIAPAPLFSPPEAPPYSDIATAPWLEKTD